MEIIGIICEYNPLHIGHKKQINKIRLMYPDSRIVCLMSGNYVQRGAPAIFDKSLRAQAAISCGADLVLELPITAALSSAEGFANEGVRILGSFCHKLCFGAECGNKDALLSTAKALLSEAFPKALRTQLDKGLSFPAARQAALLAMGLSENTLSNPNDILATEYCKAILTQSSTMEPLPILREGNYHDTAIDTENPSASALRDQILSAGQWLPYVPEEGQIHFQDAVVHCLSSGEQAILYRLRTMCDGEFESLPYGSEGLWRKLMHSARKYATLEEIIAATKSKRYTRTRIDRMVMCAFLGISQADMDMPAPYTRVLAFNDRGREVLKNAKKVGQFPNAGAATNSLYEQLENRAGLLYSLFASIQETPAHECDRRVYYKK